jgi:hypothetical protein
MARPWKKTIDIKVLLRRDQGITNPVYVSRLGEEIAALMRAKTPEVEQQMLFLDAVERLESIDPVDGAIDEFNDALSELYDWADRERVWLGL